MASQLLKKIEAGEYDEALPGVRKLAVDMGVSVPTVSKALRSLGTRGILESCGEKRRWRVASRPSKPVAAPEHAHIPAEPPPKRRLLFLSPKPMYEIEQSSVDVFAELVNVMSRSGWDVMHRVMSYEEARMPRQSWDELLTLVKPEVLVGLSGTPVLARWAKEKKLRLLFLGGTPGTPEVPSIGISVGNLAGELITKMAALGHQRIMIPMCGRLPDFSARFKNTIEMHLKLNEIKGVEVFTPESAYLGPDVLLDLLKRHWDRIQPDAFITLDWREFLTASCFFRERRIEIPRDISVGLLSHASNLDWYLPRISHYRYPTGRLARAVAKWALGLHGPAGQPPQKLIPAHWVDGDSIRDRRNG